MRKLVILPAVFALIIALLLAAGCGNKTTVKTPQGSADIEEGGGGGKITLNEGGESATLEQSQTAPTEAVLGAPIYPGAEYDAENSGFVDYSNQGASSASGTARFLTSDSYNSVVEWYRGKLGDEGSNVSDIAQWTIGDVMTGIYTIVQVEQSEPKTIISITHMAVSIQ